MGLMNVGQKEGEKEHRTSNFLGAVSACEASLHGDTRPVFAREPLRKA